MRFSMLISFNESLLERPVWLVALVGLELPGGSIRALFPFVSRVTIPGHSITSVLLVLELHI